MSMIVADSAFARIREQPHRVQRALMDELARRSFIAFFPVAWQILNPGKPVPDAPYVYAMLHRLEQMVTGGLRRLVCNIPPRHGKTEFGTTMLAAWIMGRDPAAKVFVVTYGLQLSEKITGKVRRIMEHPDYKRIFPETRLKVGENRVGHFVTTKHGECMACSQDSAITGFGTQYMLIDDFQKADEALSPVERENAITMAKNTLLSRFDNLAEGRILINMQRLHDDDISGWALRLGWPHFCLPAIAVRDEVIPLPGGKFWHRRKDDLLDPVRVPRSFLDEQRLAQGIRTFSAQYQQDCTVSDSSLVDWGWFGQYDERPARSDLIFVVQSWDPAVTERLNSDYSVGMTWGYDDEYWYLLDIIRVQLGFAALVDKVVAAHKRWRTDALVIEGGSIGSALFDQVRAKRLPGRMYNPVPRLSKEDRLAAGTAQLAAGGFLLPRDGPFVGPFKTELLGFPDYRNDDQVDAFSQFLNFIFGRDGQIDMGRDENGRRRIKRLPRAERRYSRREIENTDI